MRGAIHFVPLVPGGITLSTSWKPLLLTMAAWISTAWPLAGAADEGKFRRSPNPVSGSYFVILNGPQADLPEVRERELDEIEPLIGAAGATNIRQIRAVAHGFTVRMSEAAAIALSNAPRVR
jgi:hypothetical protein